MNSVDQGFQGRLHMLDIDRVPVLISDHLCKFWNDTKERVRSKGYKDMPDGDLLCPNDSPFCLKTVPSNLDIKAIKFFTLIA